MARKSLIVKARKNPKLALDSTIAALTAVALMDI